MKDNNKKVNKVVYAILTLLFGTIGINKFYAGKVKAGILNILFCWTLVPTILSVAEFITVLTEKADKNVQIPVNSTRRTNVLFGTSLVVFVLFVIGTIIPWESLFTKCTIFTDFNTWLGKIKIGDYALFSNLIGAPISVDMTTGSSTGVINAIGSWTMTDMAIFLFIITAIIALCSKIKFNDFIATTTAGIKKVLPVAITAMLISIVLVMMVTSGVSVTITNWIVSMAKGFNIVTATMASMIGSVLTGDFYYLHSNQIRKPLSTSDTTRNAAIRWRSSLRGGVLSARADSCASIAFTNRLALPSYSCRDFSCMRASSSIYALPGLIPCGSNASPKRISGFFTSILSSFDNIPFDSSSSKNASYCSCVIWSGSYFSESTASSSADSFPSDKRVSTLSRAARLLCRLS